MPGAILISLYSEDSRLWRWRCRIVAQFSGLDSGTVWRHYICSRLHSGGVPGTQTLRRGCVTGTVSLLLAALFDAVVDGLTAFAFFRATLFVAFPAGFFGGHQSANAADSTGVTGRWPLSVLQTLLPFLVPLPLGDFLLP